MIGRQLTFLLLTLALVVTLIPTRAFQQGRSEARTAQTRALPSGKIVSSYKRGQSGARPDWVDAALARSLGHLRREGAALGLAKPDAELSLLSVLRDDLGQTHVRLDQVYQSVPVFGGQIITHLDSGAESQPFTTGRVFKDARLVNTNPRIDAARALAIAKQEFGRFGSLAREGVELVILPEAVRLGSDNDAPGATLVYKVELYFNDGRDPARHFYFIDARSGRIVWDYDNLQTGIGHGLYSGTVGIGTVFNGFAFEMRDVGRTNGAVCGTPGIITSDFQEFSGPCFAMMDMDDDWGSFSNDTQSQGVDAHHFAALTFDYFLGFHGLNSVDGAGRQMCNQVNLFDDNAFWDGQCTIYGSGPSFGRHFATTDVVGHEYTHAVTEFTNGPAFNFGQSGGLNESFSDIFGTRVEFFRGVNPDYLVGEDINFVGFRNMANPRSDGNSIDHASQFFNGMDPHFSSGLQNVAFFLLAESGNHPTTGVFVKKIGRERAAAVYFRALTVYLTPTATFASARQAVELATRDLYSTGNPIWNAARKSWFSVGVGGDVPFNPIDTSNDFVAWHYRDFLQREPDSGGLNFWAGIINNCGADAACEDFERVHISRAFWESGEFQSRPDVQASGLLTGNPAHPFDNHQFIRWCYLNYLRREPDPLGWQFWENGLNSHGDYNAIIRAFLCAAQYRQRFGPA